MHFIGLFEEGALFKVAVLGRSGKTISIQSLRSVRRMCGLSSTKPMPEVKKFATSGRYTLIYGMAAQKIAFRRFTLAIPKQTSIKKLLPFQIEKLTPYKVDDTIAAPLINNRSDQHELFTTSKHLLEKSLTSLAKHDVFPDRASSQQSALVKWAEYACPNLESYQLIYVGLHHTLLIVVEACRICFSHHTAGGISELLDHLVLDTPNLTQDERINLSKKIEINRVCAKKYPHLRSATDRVKRDLQRGRAYAETKVQGFSRLELVLSGHLNRSFPITSFFEMISHKGAFPIPKKSELSQEDLTYFAIPIGLAIEGMKSNATSINFMVDAFEGFNTRRIKKRAKRLYFATSFALVALIIAGHFTVQREGIKQITSSLRPFLDHPPPNSITDLTLATNSLESKILKERVLFNLSSKPPSISKLMSWMNNTIENSSSLREANIQIIELHYSIESRPQPSKPNQNYKVDTRILYSAASKASAEEFKSALCTSAPGLDKKCEVVFLKKGKIYEVQMVLR